METGQVPRRDLILCCDGTNNTLTGGERDTNVLLLFRELRRMDSPDHLLYYDPGVGSPDELPPTGVRQYLRRKWDRLAGLASGQGVFENIGQAYSFLMREYRAGDRIWLFGFSRGAFTARSVSGMVNLFGIMRREHHVLLPTLLRVYFARAHAGDGPRRRGSRRNRELIARQIRDTFTSPEGRAAAAWFVGVWDTVESVGMPVLSLQMSATPTIVNKRILHVRHALSLDEHRWPFLPRLYADADFGDPRRGDPQSLRQAWFSGVHSDVGGGYPQPEAGLAHAALAWMVDEANTCGLGCPPVAAWQAVSSEPLAHDALYDTPWWALAGMTARSTIPPGAPVVTAATAAGRRPSVWDRRRPLLPVAVALLACALGLGASGAMLLSDFDSPLGLLTRWPEAARTAADFAGAQATAFFDRARPFALAPAGTTSPRWAMAWDLVLVAGYAYLLARVGTRAFTRRTGWRQPGERAPAFKLLGGALPLLVAGDVVEDALTALAFSCQRGSVWAQLTIGLGSLGSLAKGLGALGCVLLAGLGWFAPRRTTGPAPPKTMPRAAPATLTREPSPP